jgi:hypothetical protein
MTDQRLQRRKGKRKRMTEEKEWQVERTAIREMGRDEEDQGRGIETQTEKRRDREQDNWETERFKIRWNWKREAAMQSKEREHGSKKWAETDAKRNGKNRTGTSRNEDGGEVQRGVERNREGYREGQRGVERDREG